MNSYVRRRVFGDANRNFCSWANLIRLSKLMVQQNLCSRREAERYISAGHVYVNGEQVESSSETCVSMLSCIR